MAANNDITGDKIITPPTSKAYRDNYDQIFRKNKNPFPNGNDTPQKYPGEWLDAIEKRLDDLGLESGQSFIFHFDRDPKKDWVENLGSFERPKE